MKIGKHEIDVNENDLILDNGACCQLVTREVGVGFSKYSPMMSKKMFKELKKSGVLYTNDELIQLANKRYTAKGLTLYKFDINKI